jgi:hypothetical protein
MSVTTKQWTMVGAIAGVVAAAFAIWIYIFPNTFPPVSVGGSGGQSPFGANGGSGGSGLYAGGGGAAGKCSRLANGGLLCEGGAGGGGGGIAGGGDGGSTLTATGGKGARP